MDEETLALVLQVLQARRLETLDREKNDSAARSLSDALERALGSLTPEQRERLAKNLAEQAKASPSASSQRRDTSDLAKKLSTPEGAAELAASLRALADAKLNIADLLHDPHYKARGTYIEVEHPLGFRETIYGSYVKLSHSPVDVRPGPVIGQDNEHVFKNILGLSTERYDDLVARKVIY